MNAPDPAPALRFSGVHLKLGGAALLRDVSLDLPPGGTLGLIGPGGAGKSLILKLICGLLRADAGTVAVGGVDLKTLSPTDLQARQRQMGMVFQNNALFDTLTVAQNIAFPLRNEAERDPAGVAGRVDALLARVHLHGAGPKLPAALSGGMKKRVCLARAAIHRPPLLLCDDPTAGLDPVTTQRIFALLAELRAESGATLVVASHEVDALCGLCDRLALVDAGRIGFEGSVAEARASNDGTLRAFLTGEGVA